VSRRAQLGTPKIPYNFPETLSSAGLLPWPGVISFSAVKGDTLDFFLSFHFTQTSVQFVHISLFLPKKTQNNPTLLVLLFRFSKILTSLYCLFIFLTGDVWYWYCSVLPKTVNKKSFFFSTELETPKVQRTWSIDSLFLLRYSYLPLAFLLLIISFQLFIILRLFSPLLFLYIYKIHWHFYTFFNSLLPQIPS
jgi:hypothetical protein